MDSNHRCLGVGQKSLPLDHGIEVDSPGLAPGSSVCRTDVFLLDHEPEMFVVTERKPWDSNPQASFTRCLFSSRFHLPRPGPSSSLIGRRPGLASGRMTSVLKMRELESNQRLRVQSPASLPTATIPQIGCVEGQWRCPSGSQLRGQESNLHSSP